MATAKRKSKTSKTGAFTLDADEKHLIEIWRKGKAVQKAKQKPIVMEVTADEKRLVEAYRTGEYYPVRLAVYDLLRDKMEAWYVERLKDYQPLGVYGDDAEMDTDPPTALEMVAVHIAHHLVNSFWIARHMIFSAENHYGMLVQEIAESMLAGMLDTWGDLGHAVEWVEYTQRGLLPVTSEDADAAAVPAQAAATE